MAKFVGASVQTKLCDELEKTVLRNGKSRVSDICTLLSADRAAWYRWKNHKQRLTLAKARQLCNAAGLDPSFFLDGADTDEQEIIRPRQKYDQILPLYRKYRTSDNNTAANALLVETACSIQEILWGNDIQMELSTQLGKEIPNVILQRSEPWLRLQLRHGKSPVVNVLTSPEEPHASFLLGREALPELVKCVVLIDNKVKSVHKKERNVLENMANRLIART